MMLLAEASSGSDASEILSLFWAVLAVAVAPIVARAFRGFVPDVVVLLVLGMILGPFALDWADTADLETISQLGLGMLFLLAGYELDPQLLSGRPGRVARLTWLASLGLALATISLARSSADFTARIAVAIALTSTALGTLLPIIKQLGLLDRPLGRAVMAHGAVGELGPVLAMSLLLTSRNVGAAAVVVALFGVAAVIIWIVPQRMLTGMPGVGRVFADMAGGTTQLPVRVVMVLLLTLMTVAEVFGLDVVLGAFAAGAILRRLIGPDHPTMGHSLEVLGYGVFIPIFFVTSGMGIDVEAVVGEPGVWLLFVVSIAIARGLPVWLSERYVPHGANLPSPRERAQLALYAATGLPIIVAVTQFATSAELMSNELASILVAAGATTVLVFPMMARFVGTRADRPPKRQSRADLSE
ncbi:putative solute/hydrogen antiporter [Gordonia rhizosphera NBRC 16068]|uniref:Putative solute/hydrogen antiporter n=2 Tax=Gordonia rhizosphera TaxID=83341 RepID=K6WHJ7_9ACTN|nr:putative solute/hydrogen antiporter [Gordonia rhizosphera NBRC 16068]